MLTGLPPRTMLRRLAYLAVSTSLGALAMASSVSSARAQFVCSGYENGPIINLPELQALAVTPQASTQALLPGQQTVGDGGSLAWDYGSVACGKNAFASGQESTAVGFNTSANGGRSVAVGSGAYAGSFGYGENVGESSANATAVGTSALAGNRASAFGADSNANIDASAFGAATYAGQRSVAVGGNAYSGGTDSVAVGYGANSGDQPGQVAIGANARIGATVAGTDAPLPGLNVALGKDSLAARGAQANYVAYGLDAPANSIGEVSVGTDAGNRQITGVAPGSAGTDAVNVDQLAAVGTRISSISGQVAGFGSRLDTLEGFVAGGIPVSAYVPVDTSNASGLARPSAAGADALALGYGANASGNKAIAIGRAVASGSRSAAIGDGATASGTDGVALGGASVASGTASTAVGTGARATGLRSLALGAGSSAENDNATAIGAGARTTRANQVAVGTTSSTYTLGGVASANSRAQQSGPAYFATTDAQGNLAATTFDTTRIDTMDNHISAVDQRVGNVENRVGNVENRVGNVERNVGILRNDVRRNSEGVSIAMAMAGVQLAPEKTYSLSANWGTFEGENGFAATGAARISDSTVIHAGVGVGGNRGTVGGRAGVTFGW